MVERKAIIRNSAGIHCRPSACIVKAASSYPGQIAVRTPSGSCDPRSIMALIAMGLDAGAEIVISVEGPDEEAQCGRLVELFETHFDFPHRHAGEDTQTLLRDMRKT